MAKDKVRKTYTFCPLWKRLLLRFLRGFVSAGLPLFITFISMDPTDWTFAALFAVLMGGIAGGLQALDKLFRERYQ